MKIFLRVLAVNAALQFATTRMKAGRADDEGDAEAMWARFPVTVLFNTIIWSLMISTLSRLSGPLRRRRA